MLTSEIISQFNNQVMNWRGLTLSERENVVSAALERFLTNDDYSKVVEPLGWLLRAAYLIKREQFRRRKKEQTKSVEWREQYAPDRRRNGQPFCGYDGKALSHSGEEMEAAGALASQACDAAMNSLTPIQRRVVEQCWLLLQTPAEAARVLSLGRSTTKSHLARAQRKLAKNPALRELCELARRGTAT